MTKKEWRNLHDDIYTAEQRLNDLRWRYETMRGMPSAFENDRYDEEVYQARLVLEDLEEKLEKTRRADERAEARAEVPKPADVQTEPRQEQMLLC